MNRISFKVVYNTAAYCCCPCWPTPAKRHLLFPSPKSRPPSMTFHIINCGTYLPNPNPYTLSKLGESSVYSYETKGKPPNLFPLRGLLDLIVFLDFSKVLPPTYPRRTASHHF